MLRYWMSTCNCQRHLVDESGMIRKQMGTHNRSEVAAVYLDPDSESSAALFLRQSILKSDLASGRSVLKLTQNNNHTVNTPLQLHGRTSRA
jgi:hypothetical protein